MLELSKVLKIRYKYNLGDYVKMNEFSKEKLIKIQEELQIEGIQKEVTIEYKNNSFVQRMKDMVRKDRHGEVVFGVIRPNGKIIAVTCKEYPKGIFRIPTGGINFGEDVIEAVQREVMEELGLKAKIVDFGGVLKVKFKAKEEQEMFYCYLFLLEEQSGRLLMDATDAEVSEVIEADSDTLLNIANKLENIDGKWSDWGKFRYLTTAAIHQMYISYINDKR